MRKISSTVLSIRASDKNLDRVYDTDSNFMVRVSKIPNVVKTKVQNIMVPLSFYNITNANNQISFNDGVSRIATLTNGTYNITQLLSSMKTVMDAVSTLVYTLTYNSITQKVTISSTSNFSLVFTNLLSDLPKLLGFNHSSYSGTNSYVSPNIVNINRRFSQINVHSSNLSRFNSQYVSSYLGDNSLICRINNSVYKPGEYCYYSNDDNSGHDLGADTKGSLEYVDIQLRDVDSNLFDFNGVSDGLVINIIVYFLL